MDLKITALIEDKSKWILPELAPNGTYFASPICNGGSGHGGIVTKGYKHVGRVNGGLGHYIGVNGEEVCEGHGYPQITCESLSCCQWDNGQCWSAVGQDACSNNTPISTTTSTTTGEGPLFEF